MSDRPHQVTQILADLSADDSQAAARLLPLVYEELRSLASHKLANEPPDHTLQATALVHEAYLRLLGSVHQNWDNRGHFFAAAAAMSLTRFARCHWPALESRIRRGFGVHRQRLRLTKAYNC